MQNEYALGYCQQRPGQKGFDIHVVTRIERDEFEAYIDAISAYRALTERNTYQVMQANQQTLVRLQDAYANIERLGGSFRAVNTRDLNIFLMGAVTNWLTSTRLYLESERDFIERQYGNGSNQMSRYKAATAHAFDSYSGYRFLYNLRDYAQHCGPPLSGIVIRKDENGKRKLELYLRRSDLLVAKFNWSRHARALLKDWPEEILLMSLVEEAMEGLRTIEDELLRILLEGCAKALPVMHDARVRVGARDGHPAVFLLPDNDKGKLTWQTFPEPSMLQAIEHAVTSGDPLAAIRRPPEGEPGQPAHHQHADSQAAAVVGVWLEHGPGPELVETINRVLEEDGSIDPLVNGLVNLTAVLLAMMAQALGSSPQSLLGSFVARNTEP